MKLKRLKKKITVVQETTDGNVKCDISILGKNSEIALKSRHATTIPAIALLDICPREMRSYVWIKTCIPLFIVSLLVIANPKLAAIQICFKI